MSETVVAALDQTRTEISRPQLVCSETRPVQAATAWLKETTWRTSEYCLNQSLNLPSSREQAFSNRPARSWLGWGKAMEEDGFDAIIEPLKRSSLGAVVARGSAKANPRDWVVPRSAFIRQ